MYARNFSTLTTTRKADPTKVGGAKPRVLASYQTPSATTSTLGSQQTVTAAFTHEFGSDGDKYAVFGRYTFGDGGEGRTSESLSSALPLDDGGFVGFAWNKPFGRDSHQVSAALMYGEPTENRESLGINDQYGIETYWKVRVRDWLSVTADIQVVNNIDKDLEVVPGLRVKINK